MKILHATDLHFNKKRFEWITNEGSQLDYDILCLTGDFLNTSYKCKTPIEQQIDWITGWTSKLDRPTFICSGNHDIQEERVTESLKSLFMLDEDDDYREAYFEERLSTQTVKADWILELANRHIFVDHSITNLNGIKIGCAPYGTEDFSKYHHCDILLNHQPPANTETSTDKLGDWGCPNLRAALDQKDIEPRLILSGHIHKPIKNRTTLGDIEIRNPGVNTEVYTFG